MSGSVAVRFAVIRDGRVSRHAVQCVACRVVVSGRSRAAVARWAAEHSTVCPHLLAVSR